VELNNVSGKGPGRWWRHEQSRKRGFLLKGGPVQGITCPTKEAAKPGGGPKERSYHYLKRFLKKRDKLRGGGGG